MDDSFNNFKSFDDDNSIDLKQEVSKFLRYWPWFVLALFIALISAYVYLRFAPRIYQTSAKMKILDESEGLELPTSAFVFKRVNINLENEIQILTSYLILEKVSKELNLNTSFYEEGTIQTAQIAQLPFSYEQIINPDSISTGLAYSVIVKEKNFEITNLNTDKTFKLSNNGLENSQYKLPFNLKLEKGSSLNRILGKKFIIKYGPLKSSALKLKSRIKVEPVGEQSDLLELSIKGESKELSELILNKLMDVFNNDGINDRQLVSKRTLEFIDERFVFLAEELDSIEIDRKDFKHQNNLVDFTADAELGLQQRTKSDEEVFKIETQIALAQLVQQALKADSGKGLLPSNIGIDNSGINGLISEYNLVILERDKLTGSGAGVNNPTVMLIESKIDDLRTNLTQSLNSYNQQLQVSQNQLKGRNRKFVGQVAQIPEKDRLLRAIERQQKIKESLYILLLQKREEAAINLAITEPSIKIVDNAISDSDPISPKSNIVYAGAILGGLLIPFGILYLIFMLDTKLHSKEDINNINPKIPVIGEIPDVKKTKDILFSDPNARTALAESFRILSSNVDYILPVRDDKKAKVIYCTSTIKGEGKTYISVNLSLALSSINKKVLLIGADLRNPQIHTHIHQEKHKPGLSNYLHDINYDWKDSLIRGFDKHPNHHIILSGSIPPNPAQLLTNGRFKKLIEEAKDEYDYIVVDTAPTILVTDTMLISQLADATIYLARANYTEKNLLRFSKDLSESGKLKNMAYVVNSVGASKSYGYGYNYGYNYGYGNKE